MSEIKDVPAFPHPEYLHSGWTGMTLRDYIASKALVGWMSSLEPHRNPADNADEMASSCYEIADAMLRARGES
ncbi:hypothetical protein [Paraburkholderia phenoliruptrix]|uniref:hypothetical protein n=1 Tax=Paraburkholderia phenoliruptrix TaxID=252970 RepID=UPI0028599B9B|nr:hypothetical protein [Paraburkholderia phenoliruptrix]MDR6393485.1 hypothetical protein [Paraburkholderia phenoliruptrix]